MSYRVSEDDDVDVGMGGGGGMVWLTDVGEDSRGMECDCDPPWTSERVEEELCRGWEGTGVTPELRLVLELLSAPGRQGGVFGQQRVLRSTPTSAPTHALRIFKIDLGGPSEPDDVARDNFGAGGYGCSTSAGLVVSLMSPGDSVRGMLGPI